MKLLCAKQFAIAFCLLNLVMVVTGYAEEITGLPDAAVSVTTASYLIEPQSPVRAFPRVHLWGSQQLTYVGMFSPDAVFRAPSRLGIPPAVLGQHSLPQSGAPESMLLSNERVVEDLEPPAHFEAHAQALSPAGKSRNRFVTSIYGRPSVLHAPTHVATDSQGRVILSDPEGNAVHVLDPKGKTSFRIVSGKGRRLRQPAGVAVDGEDNIYVADADRGIILVFDRYGNFVRNIGDYMGEPQYASPNGLAIDRKARRIYVVDSPRNMVFMLELNGRLLKTLGRARNGNGVAQFDYPTEVALSRDRVFVLDSSGGRVQIMDSDCNSLGTFDLPRSFDRQVNQKDGLGADQRGNIYVSSFNGSVIRIYNQAGSALASFGRPGRRVGEFERPDGLWIDSTDRLYVADSGNGRVQLFQLNTLQ